MAFALVLRANPRLECFLVFDAPRLPARLDTVAANSREHRGRLLAPHHRNPRIRPHPQEAWIERTSAHPVVAGAVAAADDHGELRHLRTRYGRDHFRAVARDATRLVFLADHEAGNVLQKYERDAALHAKLDEMRALQRRFRIENAVVRDNADRITPDSREASDERRSVARFELVEVRIVDDARDHFADVVRLADIRVDDAIKFIGRVPRRDGLGHVQLSRLARVQVADHPP